MARLTETLREVGRAVTFFPGVAKWIGREECIFICQMLYWKTDDNEWIWKTAAKIEDETSLTPREQRRVRGVLIEQGILQEKDAKQEHRIYFRIDEERLNELWSTYKKDKRACDAASQGYLRSVTRLLTQRHMLTSEKSPESTKEYKKTVAPSRNPSTLRGGFFGSENTFEDRCAERLHQAICSANQLQRKANLGSWARQFTELQAEGVNTQRIKLILSWYISRIGKKYIPQAYSAKSFREKFSQIEKTMEHSEPETATKKEYSEEVLEITKDLKRELQWPARSLGELSECVDQSLIAYRNWHSRRRAIMNKLHDEHAMLSTDRDLAFSVIRKPTSFVRVWFKLIHKKNAKWKEWSGALRPLIFSESQTAFQVMGIEAIGESRWNRYINFLKPNA